ncbi:MAG: phosphate/phosphite/phosphonate ABC transporter substrate-binding protein [Paracoccaceae bacterium]
MYDWPEVQTRNDAFWLTVRDALRSEGLAAPDALARPKVLSEPWPDPGLLLGQTCGLPYVSGHCGSAVLVARPTYAIEGTGDGTYSSALICRADDDRDLPDFKRTRAAINEVGSQSGCNALVDAFLQTAPIDGPLFREVVLSGGHRFSAGMVADSKADIAAIDAVSWALHKECEPKAHGHLRVLAWTRPMPALPFITAPCMTERIPLLRRALEAGAAEANGTGAPVAIRTANDPDYDSIRTMAQDIAGIVLS